MTIHCKNMTLKLIISVILFLNRSYCIAQDYYWKDYFGVIPEDAFVAGKTNEGMVYIGQAYLKNVGLIPTKIKPGVNQVEAPYGGSTVVNKYIKILCCPEGSLYWMQTNTTAFHSQVIDKHVVIGGHQDPDGILNIGRLHEAGDIKVGKISSFWAEAALYYSDSGKEHRKTSYEVLMNKDDINCVDTRVGA